LGAGVYPSSDVAGRGRRDISAGLCQHLPMCGPETQTLLPNLAERGIRTTRLRCCLFLLFVPLCLAPTANAQPGNTPPTHASTFQSRIDDAALALRNGDPRFKDASPETVERLVEFASGNMLFVLLHELGHAVITQMGLPVLGRIEDAADTFAVLMLLRMGSDFSHRVLVDAAEGWFLAARRDEKTGHGVAFYSEHALSEQRAYQIVCIMVGSDRDRFADLATETRLPEARQDTCLGDYSNAAFSWDLLLKPHLLGPDQPKTTFDVVYGPAEGGMAAIRAMARAVLLLETVAEHATHQLAWPRPLTLKMETCGFANARWDIRSREVVLCYELGAGFADLYRDFGEMP
jgi:Putative metallopeptidase